MKLPFVRIGNSRGVRLPRAFIEQAGLGEKVELTVEAGAVVIRAARKPREGWEESFKQMADAGDDEPLLPDHLSREWDESEWTW